MARPLRFNAPVALLVAGRAEDRAAALWFSSERALPWKKDGCDADAFMSIRFDEPRLLRDRRVPMPGVLARNEGTGLGIGAVIGLSAPISPNSLIHLWTSHRTVMSEMSVWDNNNRTSAIACAGL
jgi:hypothetical protein